MGQPWRAWPSSAAMVCDPCVDMDPALEGALDRVISRRIRIPDEVPGYLMIWCCCSTLAERAAASPMSPVALRVLMARRWEWFDETEEAG